MVNLLVNAHTCDRTIGRAWIECVWSKSGFCATAGKVGHPFFAWKKDFASPRPRENGGDEIQSFELLNAVTVLWLDYTPLLCIISQLS